MVEFPFAAPVRITKEHDTSAFDCGKPPLNEFLQRYALASEAGASARTFVVATTAKVVIGYYSLAAAGIAHDDAPERVKKSQPQYPIPAILMARFAIDVTQQGKGLGRALFRDAWLRSLNITDALGARAFVVDAKDDEAATFYRKFDMMAAPGNPYRLYLLFKDVKKILAE